MIYHGLYDFIIFLFQGGINTYGDSITSAVQPTMAGWQAVFFRVAIYTAIALLIIYSKRRQNVIARNLAQM